jgi:hypothetical protein
MSCTLLHMSSIFYVKETLLDCPNLSFIMTTDNQNITRMIWSPLQIKNPNCLVEAMLLIVLSHDPNMQAKRKYIQQELDLENGYNILETKKPKLKGAKYVRECYARKHLQLKRQHAQFWKLTSEANDQMSDETTKLLHAWIPKEEGSASILCWYLEQANKIEFYEKKQLNLHHNFVDVVQSKMTSLADGNDNIADQASKTSSVLLAQSTDPINAKLKFPVCKSICDVETADSASVLMNDDAMNDEDAMFDDEVDELPASSVQELPLIKDYTGKLATIARGSLFPDNVAETCILQVAKAAVTMPTPNNQPRSLALEQGGNNNA